MSYTTVDAEALPAGTLIDGRYELIGRLGRGGFAWVYEARHTDLGRSAALKLLDPPRVPAADSFRKRFMREAKIVARLNHPNIVSVWDFGVHDPTSQPYIAMELLAGHDLEDELRTNGPLEPTRAQKLFLGIAEALRVAHAEGVVHKDLKPSNLFIADPGTASERMVLLDFGIARALDDESRITKAGAFTGTPAYVAPEYARTIEVSPAVDIYQLGLILSESLSGVPCVDARAPMQMILAHCNGDIVIPESVKTSVFGPVVMRATSFAPEDRHQDGAAFSAALMAIDASTMPRSTSMRRPGEARTAQYVYEESKTDEMNAPTLLDEPVEPIELDRPEPTVQRTPRAEPTRSVPQQPSSEMWWGWYVASALALVIIAGVAYQLTRPEPLPQRAPVTLPVTVEGPRFTIASTPSGALVFDGEAELGRTPITLMDEQVDGSERLLRIELDGHEARESTVTLEDGGRLDVFLKEENPKQFEIVAPPSPRDRGPRQDKGARPPSIHERVQQHLENESKQQRGDRKRVRLYELTKDGIRPVER